MARPKKDSIKITCSVAASSVKKINELSEKTSLSKTSVVERAVEMYYENYRNTGKI